MRFTLVQLALLIASWLIAFGLSPFLKIQTVRGAGHNETHTGNLVRWIGSEFISKADLVSLGQTVPYDSWRRPIQIIETELGEFKRVEGQTLVYSFGSDGLSESNGNDPDDINSWDDHHHAFYRAMIHRNQIRIRLWRTVWATPLVFAGLSGMLYVISFFSKRRPSKP